MFRSLWIPCKSSRVFSLGKNISRDQRVRSIATKTVTGSWETIQYRGHQVASFVPLEMPPTVDLSHRNPMMNCTISESIQEAENNLRDLREKSKDLPESLMSGILKKEAVVSNQIELNTRTLTDVMKESSGFSHPRTTDEKDDLNEVFNYIEAFQLGSRLAQSSPVLTVEMLEQIHKTCLVDKLTNVAEVMPGKMRTSQVALGAVTAPYSRSFFPPPPKYVRRLVENLLNYMNEETNGLPYLAKLGIAHAQFETIHPFMDGNGPVGRLLLMLRMVQSGLLDRFTLYPSYAFKVCRWLYFNCLHDTRVNGRWENWLHFFIGSISHTAIDAQELISDLLLMHQRNKQVLGHSSNGHRAASEKLLNLVYRLPYVKKFTVAVVFDEDYALATQMLDLFTRHGILEISRDEKGEVWYHNRALLDELNKERHIASYATMLKDFLQIPATSKDSISEDINVASATTITHNSLTRDSLDLDDPHTTSNSHSQRSHLQASI